MPVKFIREWPLYKECLMRLGDSYASGCNSGTNYIFQNAAGKTIRTNQCVAVELYNPHDDEIVDVIEHLKRCGFFAEVRSNVDGRFLLISWEPELMGS